MTEWMSKYRPQQKTLVLDFNGVLGAFSRIISGKELKGQFNSKEFVNNIVDQIGRGKYYYKGVLQYAVDNGLFGTVTSTLTIDRDLELDVEILEICPVGAIKYRK